MLPPWACSAGMNDAVVPREGCWRVWQLFSLHDKLQCMGLAHMDGCRWGCTCHACTAQCVCPPQGMTCCAGSMLTRCCGCHAALETGLHRPDVQGRQSQLGPCSQRSLQLATNAWARVSRRGIPRQTAAGPSGPVGALTKFPRPSSVGWQSGMGGHGGCRRQGNPNKGLVTVLPLDAMGCSVLQCCSPVPQRRGVLGAPVVCCVFCGQQLAWHCQVAEAFCSSKAADRAAAGRKAVALLQAV